MIPSLDKVKNIVNNNIKLFGKSLYLFGTAKYGKTFTPVKINSLSHLYSEFGEYGSLIDVYISIKGMVNGINVYCVKISGHSSKCCLNINIPDGDVINNAICFQCHKEYNDIKLSVFNDSLVFEFPNKETNNIFEYKINQYEPLDNLIKRINNDDNDIECFCNCDNSIKPYGNIAIVNPSVVYFCGGESGLNASKLTLYNNLSTAFDLLRGELIDVYIPIDCFIDDEYDFYKLCIDFSMKQLSHGILSLGVMGFNSKEDDLDKYVYNVKQEVKNLKLEQYKQYSSLVQIFAGSVITSYNVDYQYNGYAIYGALLCNVDMYKPPTSYNVDKNVFLYQEFNNKQLRELTELGVMCFRNSPLKQCIVCANNRTPCNSKHYKFINVVRAIEISTSCLHDICTILLGCNYEELMQNNNLEKILCQALNILVENNLLNYYNINIQTTNDKTNIEHNESFIINLKLKNQYMNDFIERKGALW